MPRSPRSARTIRLLAAVLAPLAVAVLAGCATSPGGREGVKAASAGEPAEASPEAPAPAGAETIEQAPPAQAGAEEGQAPVDEEGVFLVQDFSGMTEMEKYRIFVAGPPSRPPDGQWRTDDPYGRRYFVWKIPKVDKAYRFVDDESRVQLVGGLSMDVVDHDEHSISVKVYGPSAEVAARLEERKSRPARGPMSEAEAEAEAQAQLGSQERRVYVPEGDRISFQRFDRGLPTGGQWRNGLDLADMNGDGHLDIVHGPLRKGPARPLIFLGDGTGEWRQWNARFPAGLSMDYGDVEVADLNGDGIPDLALAMHLRGMLALLGDGEGTFTAWHEGLDYSRPDAHEGPATYSSRALALVDWNGDGRPDLLTLGEGPSFGRATGSPTGETAPEFRGGARGPVLYINQGDGTWVRQDQGTGGAQNFGDSVVVGDFDGDGHPDFATASNNRGQKDLVNFGRPDGSWEKVEVEVVPDEAVVRGLRAADFDGDGRDDLAIGYVQVIDGEWRTGLDLLFYSGEGWERLPLASDDSREGIWAIGAGDLDGDGRTDVVAVTGFGDVWVFLGRPGRGFVFEASPELSPPDWGCTGYDVEIADLDGDGAGEMVLSFAGEPGSEQLIPGARSRCPSGGGLRVWKPVAH